MHSTIIKLKNYKETKNLTIKNLAEVLGVHKMTVSAWFRGINTPRGETLIANEQRFAIENGILVKRNSKGEIFHINPALCPEAPYFVERKIPLKLEVGKRYKDKEGRVWVIYREHETYFNGIQEHSGEQADFEEEGVAHGVDSTMDLVEEI